MLLREFVISGSLYVANLSLTGYYYLDDELFSFGIGNGYVEIPTSQYGLVGLLGSGTKTWTSRMHSLNWKGIGSERSSRMRASKAGLVFSSNVINEEVISSRSLHEHVGGGCELAVSRNGQFMKYGDVLYLCWIVNSANDKALSAMKFPLRAFHYVYHRDLLLIRTYEPSLTDDTVESKVFMIPPVFREVTKEEMTKCPVPNFNAFTTCVEVMVSSDFPRVRPFSMIQFAKDQTQWFRFHECEGALQVTVDPSFYRTIAQRVRRYGE